MAKSILRDKSYSFALKVIRLYKQLCEEKKEFTLSRQLLKAGTSPGANLREAQFAQSTADLIAKYSIALKEINETNYWLELLRDSGYITEEQAETLIFDATEILKMLITAIKSLKGITQNQSLKPKP